MVVGGDCNVDACVCVSSALLRPSRCGLCLAGCLLKTFLHGFYSKPQGEGRLGWITLTLLGALPARKQYLSWNVVELLCTSSVMVSNFCLSLQRFWNAEGGCQKLSHFCNFQSVITICQRKNWKACLKVKLCTETAPFLFRKVVRWNPPTDTKVVSISHSAWFVKRGLWQMPHETAPFSREYGSAPNVTQCVSCS